MAYEGGTTREAFARFVREALTPALHTSRGTQKQAIKINPIWERSRVTIPSIVGEALPALEQRLVAAHVGDYARVARELYRAVHARGALSLEQVRVSKVARAQLAEVVTLARPRIVRDQTSRDGTRKWLIALADDNLIESVYIPDDDPAGVSDVGRGAICISSQIGCTMRCAFCHTGTQPIVRNLTAAEIAAQVVLARDAMGDFTPGNRGRAVASVVLMGMGEPLMNYDAVISAIAVITDAQGLAISKRRITLSTSGIVPAIDALGVDTDVNLAISLHATTDTVRNELVPINAKWNIASLLAACRRYPATNARRILFEYVMLDGVNDSDADAHRLAELLRGIHAKVNLIPFNPWPGTLFSTSKHERVASFAGILMAAGLPSPVRSPRGRDIAAACGQLKSESVRVRADPRVCP